MNKEKFKNILKYSAILGAFLGLIAAIPYLTAFSVIIMSIFSSICVIVYMEKKQEIGELTIKGASIIGGMIGFIALSAFLIINLPLNAILGALPFKFAELYVFSRFLLSIWWILLLMGGLVTALLNAFALLAYIYVKDTYFMIEGKKEVRPDFTKRGK